MKNFYNSLDSLEKDIFQMIISELSQDYAHMEITKINQSISDMEKEVSIKIESKKKLEHRINSIKQIINKINLFKKESLELTLFKNHLLDTLIYFNEELSKFNVQKINSKIIEQKKSKERFEQIQSLINDFFLVKMKKKIKRK